MRGFAGRTKDELHPHGVEFRFQASAGHQRHSRRVTPMRTALFDVPRLFAPILPRLEADLRAHFRIPDVRVTPVGYENRPFSHILRVSVHTGQPPSERLLFVKVFKSQADPPGVDKMRQRVRHDFESTRRIADAMSTHAEFGVARPVACYLEHLAIVTEEAAGETLKIYLEKTARWFPTLQQIRELERTLSNVGRWLRAFQAVDSVGGPVMLSALCDYVDLRLHRLVVHRKCTPLQRETVLRHLNALAGEVSPDGLAEVLIHADLGPGNVLVCQGSVTVIDLAMVQRGTALHDISRLYVHLDVLRAKPQFRSSVVGRLQRALLYGYDPGLTADWPLFRFLVMLHRINHFGTLSLNRERFPGSLMSRRVLRVHRAWIDKELQQGAVQVVRR